MIRNLEWVETSFTSVRKFTQCLVRIILIKNQQIELESNNQQAQSALAYAVVVNAFHKSDLQIRHGFILLLTNCHDQDLHWPRHRRQW